MDQQSFSFLLAVPPGPRPKRQVRQIKVVTLGETNAPYAALDRPECLVRFWRAQIACADWFDADKEQLVCFSLDAQLRMRAFAVVSVGLANQTLIHAREVFRPAISVAASHIILGHNHPSGDPKPSADDIRATREMAEAGRVLGIPLLDHVIIGKPSDSNPAGYTSLKQLGVIGG